MITDKFKTGVAWFNQHREDLASQYPNQWVIVDGNSVVGAAATMLAALDLAQTLNLTIGEYVVQHAIPQAEEEPIRFVSNRVCFSSVG